MYLKSPCLREWKHVIIALKDRFSIYWSQLWSHDSSANFKVLWNSFLKSSSFRSPPPDLISFNLPISTLPTISKYFDMIHPIILILSLHKAKPMQFNHSHHLTDALNPKSFQSHTCWAISQSIITHSHYNNLFIMLQSTDIINSPNSATLNHYTSPI